jgi:putative intracellular protease/amidase
VDREIVCDGQLITNRKPEDIPVFIREMLAAFAAAPKDATRRSADASMSR